MNEDQKKKLDEETHRAITYNLIKSLEIRLKGKATHLVCSDRTTMHNKIVIEYGHAKKE